MNPLRVTGTQATEACFAVRKDIKVSGEKQKIIPNDSLSKHMFLKGSGSQGDK